MVIITERNRDVTLFYPRASLIKEMWGWVKDGHPSPLQLVAARQPSVIRLALEVSARAIIDATDHPDAARTALACSVSMLGSERTTLYTERTRAELEIYARSQGIQVHLGPLSATESEALFAWVVSDLPPVPAAVGARHGGLPARWTGTEGRSS